MRPDRELLVGEIFASEGTQLSYKQAKNFAVTEANTRVCRRVWLDPHTLGLTHLQWFEPAYPSQSRPLFRYDMTQDDLTLEGMKRGVRESDVLLVILTKHTLASWYCQQEICTAVEVSPAARLASSYIA